MAQLGLVQKEKLDIDGKKGILISIFVQTKVDYFFYVKVLFFSAASVFCIRTQISLYNLRKAVITVDNSKASKISLIRKKRLIKPSCERLKRSILREYLARIFREEKETMFKEKIPLPAWCIENYMCALRAKVLYIIHYTT